MNKNVKIILGIVLVVLLIVGLFFLSSLAGSKNFKEISYNEYQNLIKESGNYVVYIGNKDSDALKIEKNLKDLLELVDSYDVIKKIES